MTEKTEQVEHVSKVCPHRNKSPVLVIRGYKSRLKLFLECLLGILPLCQEYFVNA
jgi:hypothetical protein